MPKVEVFEPPLCCATGVCGADLDRTLVTFSADIDWVQAQGGDAHRYNLASEPSAFAENALVRQFLELSGSEGLPLTLVDGVTVLTGSYPARDKIARWTGVGEGNPGERPDADLVLEVAGAPTSGCCSPAPSDSGCC